MVVYYKNGMYQLNMSWLLFQSWKKRYPDTEVEIETLSSSTYQEIKKVPIRDLIDCSTMRSSLILHIYKSSP
jgi:hypothetical protein